MERLSGILAKLGLKPRHLWKERPPEWTKTKISPYEYVKKETIVRYGKEITVYRHRRTGRFISEAEASRLIGYAKYRAAVQKIARAYKIKEFTVAARVYKQIKERIEKSVEKYREKVKEEERVKKFEKERWTREFSPSRF